MTEYADNGWPVIFDGAGIDAGFAVAGVTFPGGMLAGDTSAAFRYLLSEFHSRVEPLESGWCWGYSVRENVNSPGWWSTHSTGTSADVNAPAHANGARGTFTPAQVTELRKILAECPAFLWGGDFTGTPDEMHFQLDVSAGRLAEIVAGLPATGEDDMPLNDADKAWIKEAIADVIRDTTVTTIETYDDAGTADSVPASLAEAVHSAQVWSVRTYRRT